MTMVLCGAAALAAAATALAMSGPIRADPPGGVAPPRRDGRRGEPSRALAEQGTTMRWARPAAVLAGTAVWLLVGEARGAVVGAMTALLLPTAIGRLEPALARRERLELIRTAPLVADLLAAALSAGVPSVHALPVVARAVGGPTERLLGVVHRRMMLGEPPEHAWSRVATSPGIGGIARAAARSGRTGAPLAALLTSTAAELRADATASGLAQVRAASVRAVLPLGLCLLPSFGLLGIVPVVAGLLPSL